MFRGNANYDLYISFQIDPQILLEHGVSYCRTVQYQGEFVVVFPKAFTATVTCGYNISESLHFATAKWLPLGYEAAQVSYDYWMMFMRLL